jgi:predicted metalloprotease with PDZ domain
MSQLAPFVDAAAAIDRTNWSNLFISYYTWGEAIGLALDLALRDRSNGKITLDTFMQALWSEFGKTGQKEPGMVATPYTMDALKVTLARVSGDRAFAEDFFARFIQGHDLADYAKLLSRAGLIARKRGGVRAALAGSQVLAFGNTAGARVGAPTPFGSALYKAGVDQDDIITLMDGVAMTSQNAFDQLLVRHKPGDVVSIRFLRRSGEAVNTNLTLEENVRIEIVSVEDAGGQLTPEQKQYREAWLGSKVVP